MFKGRRLLIATKHEKEKVLAPLLEEALGVTCFVAPDFDTDVLGTFTGEIEREQDPLATARRKCLMALEANDCDLGIASEGSFGPYPSMYFVAADDELLLFIDRKNNLEIVVRELSAETNFSGKQVRTEEELLDFADSVGFPSHGLILRKGKGENQDITKGITDYEQLTTAFKSLTKQHGTAFVETDMRAMLNPTRMRVIKEAAKKLVEKINTPCPQCRKPGFGVTASKKGLKCSLCGSPTNSILSYVYTCQHCDYSEEKLYPHNKTAEDPRYCQFCNP